MKSDPYLTPCGKINSNWIEDINVRAKAIKHLEENIGRKFPDTGFGNDFLDMTPKTEATKVKVGKYGYIKLRDFMAKEAIN